jgi:hypothetical protein
MKTSKKLTPSATLIISLASIGILIACGPYYAPRLLHYKSTVIQSPATGVDLMFPDNNKERNAHIHLENLPKRLRATYDADITDLKKAAPNLAKKARNDYSAIRSDMIIAAWDQPAGDLAIERPRSWLDKATLDAIPKEFSIYLRGAVAYRSGLGDQARERWKTLLALPADERKYKTIWAAWMLARTSTADGEAMQWYTKVKQYKKDGFPDSIKVTDKDWTAFFSLKSGDYSTALTIYIRRGKDNTIDSVSAANDISEVFSQALEKHHKDPKPIFNTFAKNKEHAVALSYFISRSFKPYQHEIVDRDHHQESRKTLALWINSLTESKRTDIDKELGICAATAYSIYDEKTIHLCLKAMKKPTTESLWQQAKLNTIKGKLTNAAELYRQTIEHIKLDAIAVEYQKPSYYGSYRGAGEITNDRHFNLYSEYACVELGLKHYDKALDLFLTVDNTSDAAYIAETLLSPLELLGYVRNSKTAQKSEWVKALLTRKLMRHEYFKDAKNFALDKHLKIYTSYISNYRIGIDKAAATEQRAQAFIIAADIIRDHGNELFYLENHSRPFLRVSAAGRTVHEKYDHANYYANPLPTAQEFTPKITLDEQKRIKQNYVRISPVSTKNRKAAELLYYAAMLLPMNDNHAAKLFWQAGDWTRPDPKVADKYYQALVKRCPKTQLGKACDNRRWLLHAHELKIY